MRAASVREDPHQHRGPASRQCRRGEYLTAPKSAREHEPTKERTADRAYASEADSPARAGRTHLRKVNQPTQSVDTPLTAASEPGAEQQNRELPGPRIELSDGEQSQRCKREAEGQHARDAEAIDNCREGESPRDQADRVDRCCECRLERAGAGSMQDGQPNELITAAAKNPPTANPMGTAAMVAITNRPGADDGAKSAASAIAIGMPPPSPIPVNNLNAASCAGEAARAMASEPAPKMMTEAISTGLRPSRSPNMPAAREPNKMPTLPAANAAVNAPGGSRHASTSAGTA